jgi:CheY-like chemotaxis protein
MTLAAFDSKLLDSFSIVCIFFIFNGLPVLDREADARQKNCSGILNLHPMFNNQKHFLLVDDDEDDRDIFLSVLENVAPEISCTIAPNGFEALNTLNQLSTLPDLVFLDLNMPLMDGKQFLREIQKDSNLKRLNVIVLSTSSDKDTIEQTKALGAKSFLTKPDKYSGWEEAIKEVLSNSL